MTDRFRDLSGSVDQLTNRLLWLAGLLGVLLIAVVVNSLLHGDEGGLNPVAQAAERTGNLPGGKIAMEVTYSAPGLATPIVGSGEGVFDTESGRSRIAMSVPVPGHGTTTITAVGDAKTSYVRSSAFGSELPAGRSWLGMQPLLGHNPETAFGTSGGPTSTLQMLEAVGADAERLDQQRVRGHLTTRYKATIEFDRVSQLLAKNGEAELAREYGQLAGKVTPTIPVEVWIDPQGIARRIDMVEQLPTTSGGPTLTMEMKMELFDFAPQPKIELPPKREVFDMTPLLRAELGMLDGSRYAKLVAPAGGPPLSVAEFRRKGNAICRAGLRQTRKLSRRADRLGGELHQGASEEEGAAWLRRLATEFAKPAERTFKAIGRQLASLSAPTADASEFAAALHQVPVELERIQALSVASELGSPEALKQIPDGDKSQEDRYNARWRRLGLGVCAKDTDEGSQSAQSGANIA